jgi:protein involved in polysaccharide export with SLBB domain
MLKSITAFSMLTICALTSCNQKKQTQPKVRVGDVLELLLINMPEGEREIWNGKYLVNDKGIIRLPMLGAFRVIEMSSDEASIAIEKALQDRRIYNNPDVELKLVTEEKPQQTLEDFQESQR